MSHFEYMQKLGLRNLTQEPQLWCHEENHNPRQPSAAQQQKCRTRRDVEAIRERRELAEALGISVAELGGVL